MHRLRIIRRVLLPDFRVRVIPYVFAFMGIWLASHSNAEEATLKYPLQPAVTSSPGATLKSFLDGFHAGYTIVQQRGMTRGSLSDRERTAYRNRTFGCLDLSEVPPTLRSAQREQSAAYLKEVLDRVPLPPESEWPDEEMVESDDMVQWIVPHTEITIAKVSEGPDMGKFLFTPDTVARAHEFYELIRDEPYTDHPTVTPNVINFFIAEPGPMLPRAWIKSLPAWAHYRSGGQATWQWFGLIATFSVSVIALIVIYLIAIRSGRKAKQAGLVGYLLSLAFPVAALAIPVAAKRFVSRQVLITGDVEVATTYFYDIIFLITLFFVVLGAFNRIAAVIVATPWFQPRGLDAQIVRLSCRVFGLTAAIIVLLEGGQQVGIPLTTLVAGAGVSGLALALAAQDTLKNVFGSIMISLDKPYRVGERIVVKGYDGVVEEVGLRSTKIRMLTGHQTSIPNEEMARSDIENVGRRPYIRRVADIPIPLTTPPDKIARAVDIIRDLLVDHRGLEKDFPPRVFFNEINRDSFNIRMIIWFHPPEYWDFLEFSQELNRKIVEAFDAEGIEFAPPTTATLVSPGEDRPLQLEMLERSANGGPTADGKLDKRNAR